MSTNYKKTSNCKTDSYGPVCQLWSVNLTCMHDSKLQGCGQQHKSFKVTQNETSLNKHINKALKPAFANNLFKMSCKYLQGLFSKWKMSSIYQLMTNVCVI